MAQPVTPHEHIVAAANRQHAQRAAAEQVRIELAEQRMAEIDAQVKAIKGGQP